MPVLTYQYEPYQSRHTANIADLMMRPGEARARGLQQSAEAQARAVQQVAEANAAAQRANANTWGQAISSIGQTVQNIPSTIQQYKQLDDSNKIRDAMKLGAQGREAVLGMLQKTAPHLVPTVTKQYDEMDLSAANVLKKQGEVDEMNREYIAGLASTVAEHGYDLSSAGLALQHARNTYERKKDPVMIREIDNYAQQLQDNPDDIKNIIDSAIQLSPERAKQFELAKYHGVQAQQDTRDYDLKKQIADEGAQYRRDTVEISRMREGREIAQAALNEKHRQKMEEFRAQELGLKGREVSAHEKALDQKESTVTDLTPESLDMLAKAVAMGDTSVLTRFDKNARAQVWNRASEMFAGLDVNAQRIAQNANKQSLAKLVIGRDALQSYKQTAEKNLDVFINAASKVVDTGSPWLNKPFRELTGQGLGSSDQAAYEAARLIVSPEFARIIQNPALTGILPVAAREEMNAVLNGNATMKQILAVAKILKTDAANRESSLDEEIANVETRIVQPPRGTKTPATTSGTGETPPPATPPPGAPVFERGPDGKVRRKKG